MRLFNYRTLYSCCLLAKGFLAISLFVINFLLSAAVAADDLRPASLSFKQLDDRQTEVSWRLPIKNNQRAPMSPTLDQSATYVGTPQSRLLDNVYSQRWVIEREEGLQGLHLYIEGLKGDSRDVIVRVLNSQGQVQFTQILNTETPALTLNLPETPKLEHVGWSYLYFGLEHILEGFDHLLFVFALLLIVGDWRRLVITITCFTLAHSMTLIPGALGWVQLPGPPVESVIALSIMFLARELICIQRGHTSFTARQPWLVAFAFGLLHGLGFAGALRDIGLPEGELLLALLSFNVGVELGQLVFVAAVMLCLRALKLLTVTWPRWVYLMPAYCIGTISCYWFVERLAQFY